MGSGQSNCSTDRLRDERLNTRQFDSLLEGRPMIEDLRRTATPTATTMPKGLHPFTQLALQWTRPTNRELHKTGPSNGSPSRVRCITNIRLEVSLWTTTRSFCDVEGRPYHSKWRRHDFE